MCVYFTNLGLPCANHFSHSCDACQTWPHLCVCVSLDKNYIQKWLNLVSPERDNKSWSLKNPSSLLIVSTTVQLILRKSYRNMFGWLWIGGEFGGQCMSLSIVPYITTSFFCTWKSACQHGEKKGPEWGIYRVLDLHHLDPGMVFATHSWAWNNWPLSLEGNNRFLLCLWHLGTQNFTSVSHSTNPAQDRFWSLRPKRLLSSGSSMLV